MLLLWHWKHKASIEAGVWSKWALLVAAGFWTSLMWLPVLFAGLQEVYQCPHTLGWATGYSTVLCVSTEERTADTEGPTAHHHYDLVSNCLIQQNHLLRSYLLWFSMQESWMCLNYLLIKMRLFGLSGVNVLSGHSSSYKLSGQRHISSPSRNSSHTTAEAF